MAETSKIKRILDARGVRYDWFAKEIGVSVWMFNHIEARRKNPGMGWDAYYERAAQVLGVPVEMIRPEPEAAAV